MGRTCAEQARQPRLQPARHSSAQHGAVLTGGVQVGLVGNKSKGFPGTELPEVFYVTHFQFAADQCNRLGGACSVRLCLARGMRGYRHPVSIYLWAILALINEPDLHAGFTEATVNRCHQCAKRHI